MSSSVLNLTEISFGAMSLDEKRNFAEQIGEEDYFKNPLKSLQTISGKKYYKCKQCDGNGLSRRGIKCWNCDGRGAKTSLDSTSAIDFLASDSEDENESKKYVENLKRRMKRKRNKTNGGNKNNKKKQNKVTKTRKYKNRKTKKQTI